MSLTFLTHVHASPVHNSFVHTSTLYPLLAHHHLSYVNVCYIWLNICVPLILAFLCLLYWVLTFYECFFIVFPVLLFIVCIYVLWFFFDLVASYFVFMRVLLVIVGFQPPDRTLCTCRCWKFCNCMPWTIAMLVL